MASGEIPEITREGIASYASAVNDFNRIHIDDEFARSVGLPSVVAHGPYTLTLLLDAVRGAGLDDGLRGISGRLRAPVVPGDRLQWRAEGDEIAVSNSGGLVVATVELEREGS